MILSTLQGIVGVVFAFSVAIFVHELGHFMFAKLFGVKVETFSIGFGKKLLTWRRGETEYCLSAIPFGGYVKMVGTLSKEMEEVLDGTQPATREEVHDNIIAAKELSAPGSVSLAEGIQDEINALRNKAYWKKILVFSAGCINNVLTAILIYFLMAWIGHYRPAEPSPVIGQVNHVSEELSPLQADDVIVSVANEPIETYYDFLRWFGNKENPNDFPSVIPVVLLRDGTTITEELTHQPPVTPSLPEGEIRQVGEKVVQSPTEALNAAAQLIDNEKLDPVQIAVETAAGDTTTIVAPPLAATGPWWPIIATVPNSPARIELLLPNLPAERSGLKEGDVIVSIDGEPVHSSADATRLLRNRPGHVADVVVEREDRRKGKHTARISLEVRPNPENPEVGQIGVLFSAQRTELVKKPIGEAFTGAFVQAWNMVEAYWNALKRILSSSFQTIRENLAGPVGISVQFFKMAQSGWANFLMTFALFNIILALTNLLPLPVLDGGHILFATIEAIIRRPLPAKVMIVIYNLFTFLIIGLALLITFNDLIMNSWRVLGR